MTVAAAKAVDVDRMDSVFFVPIRKTEELPDGSVMVYGLASGPEVDIDGQVMDPEWLKKAMPEWMVWGNIREMHQPSAVGKAKEYQWTEEGPYLGSKIVDPLAVKKVKEGIYNAYSIGVKNPVIVPDPKAPRGRIVGGKIIEVSLVDYPAYPKAKFTLVKAAEGGWRDMQTGVVIEKEASLTDRVEAVRRAIRDMPGGYWVVEIFDDHVIADDDCGRLWRFPYEWDEEEQKVMFGSPEEVEVEYVPKAALPEWGKAVWSTAYVNDLPDDAFAYIEPGGKKDEEGKTVPRSLRHLPYKDKNGNIDPAHVRNALQRLPQTKISEEAKRKAKKKLIQAAKQVGIKVSEDDEKGVKKTMHSDNIKTDLSPQAEARDAARMAEILRELKEAIPVLEPLIQREQAEAQAGDEGDDQDAQGLKETMQHLIEAINSLVTVLRHEQQEAQGEDKTITSQSGLSAYNLDGHRAEKFTSPDVRKVGRKMAQERLNRLTEITTKFKEAATALEELVKELGDTSFEGGDSDLGSDEGGGGPVRQTRHGTPKDKAQEMGIAMKGAGLFDLGAVVGEAVAAALVKAGLLSTEQKVQTQQPDHSSVVADIRKSLQEIDRRLRGIENQPAPAQAVQTVVVDRKHAFDPDVKKSYDGAVSKLAEQVANLDHNEREKLAAEIIKMIHGRK